MESMAPAPGSARKRRLVSVGRPRPAMGRRRASLSTRADLRGGRLGGEWVWGVGGRQGGGLSLSPVCSSAGWQRFAKGRWCRVLDHKTCDTVSQVVGSDGWWWWCVCVRWGWVGMPRPQSQQRAQYWCRCISGFLYRLAAGGVM